MSATDVLRRMLDERGVEWESKDVEGISGFHDTRWNAYDVRWCYVEFVGNNYTKLVPSSEFHCTPEQAIAATLVNSRAERTCEPKWTLQGKTQTQEFWCCECGNCGYEFGVEDRSTFPFKITIDEVDVPNFCPECGAKQKVVS